MYMLINKIELESEQTMKDKYSNLNTAFWMEGVHKVTTVYYTWQKSCLFSAALLLRINFSSKHFNGNIGNW